LTWPRWKNQALAGVLFIVPAESDLAQTTQTQGNQSPAVNAPGGSVTITYQAMSAEEKAAFAKQVADTLLAGMKTSGALPATPNAKQQITDAVTNIAKGASQGDPRLQQALNLLAAGNVTQATPLLQVVADEKSARIAQDRKDAATAYRNLGAIAGLRDPTKALLAYAKAAEYDPDDVESLVLGWISRSGPWRTHQCRDPTEAGSRPHARSGSASLLVAVAAG
jgi:tetratricopeptide (TPR) repeat protein